MEQLNARGQECPLPVVRTKKALAEMSEGVLEVLVDNETAATNVNALAKTLKYEAKTEQRSENDFSVFITKPADSCGCDITIQENNQVVVVGSDRMGEGSEELGAILMKSFIFALTQQDNLPKSILFYNGGVKWTCNGSEALDDLKKLAEEGVEIFSCGTCLAHFGLNEELAVGEVTNMYVIVEKQMEASVIIRS